MPRKRNSRPPARRLTLIPSLGLAAGLILAGFFSERARTAAHAEVARGGAGSFDTAWVRSGPRGGHVTALAVSPSSPSTVYAHVSASGRYHDESPTGLFKSTDSGAHWVRTSYPSLANYSRRILSLAVDPADASVVYAGTTRNAIFKSSDGGQTWAGPFGTQESEVLSIAVDPVRTGTLYASFAGRGVYKSTDGGVTWANSGAGIQHAVMHRLAVDPANASVVYAVGGDAGPGQFAGVYKSTNGGANWSRMNNGLPYTGVLTLAIDPSNTSTLYIGTTLGVFKSVDGGGTWVAGSAGLPTGAQIVSLSVDPGNPSAVYATSFYASGPSAGGIFKSTDAGASWARAGAGDTKADTVVADAAGANLYAGSFGGGVLKSTDGGFNWVQSNEGLPFAAVRHLVVNPNNPAVVYAGTSDDLYRSPDRGESWAVTGLPYYDRPIMGLAADPSEPSTLYAAPDYIGVLKTTDGGVTWAKVRDAENGNVHALAMDPSSPRTLYFAGQAVQLAKTADGGLNWRLLFGPLSVRHMAVDPSASSVVYAAASTGLFRSGNGGVNWGRLSSFDMSGVNPINGLTIVPSAPGALYVFTRGSGAPIRKSIDGGATWSPAAAGIPATSPGVYEVSALAADPLTPSVLYAACYGAAEAGGGVYRSADGGASWSLFQSALSSVNALALDLSGKTLYAGTDQGVYKTRTASQPVTFSADLFAADEAAGTATITVSRAAGDGPATVNYSTGDGSAHAGQDYSPASGSLAFAAGETSKTFSVPVLDDALDEFDEGVRLTLTSADGAQTVLGRASLVIADNDLPPALSVGDVSAPEGDFDTAGFAFRVSLSAPSGKTVSVDVNNASGTALVGGPDLFHYGGPYTLIFAPGETDKTVTISVRGDLEIEPDETFFVNARNVVNAAPGDLQGQGTILNDDVAPTVSLSVNDVSVVEGDAGTADAVFTVSLSGPTHKTVKVDYGMPAGAGTEHQGAGGTLTFAPGEVTKTVTVRVIGDVRFEADERFEMILSNPRNALLGDAAGVLTILNDEAPPTISVSDVSVVEGSGGEKEIIFMVTLSSDTESQVAFQYTVLPGTATQGQDYGWVGGAWLFVPGVTRRGIGVPVRGDTIPEPNETFILKVSNATNGVTIADGEGVCTIIDDDRVGDGAQTFQFDASQYTVPEDGGAATVTVTRAGDVSAAATVDYSTARSNNTRSASDRSDYTTAVGTLRFAPGEGSKTVKVLITDDAFAERDPQFGDEFIDVALSNPTGGATLGTPLSAFITIIDNDQQAASRNPVDDPQFFVRQHYADFLNRQPDQSGLNFWANQIAGCESGPEAERQGCREVRRINVSAAFFLSIEFQETGYFAYRLHKAAFGSLPGKPVPITHRDFLADSQQVSSTPAQLIVGATGWEQQLETNKRAYVEGFVARPRFAPLLALPPADFVSALNANTGGSLTRDEVDALVAELSANDTSAGRASVLRQVAQNAEFSRREKSQAFVLMQYFGYLRRDPDAAPELSLDFSGYNFWLRKLNNHGGNYITAEMVKAFIFSGEYRERFGQ